MLFIPSVLIPATDLPDAFNYRQAVSADGSNSGDAAPLLFTGTHATVAATVGGSSGTQGVKFSADFPVGAQIWLMNTGDYNVKLYVASGEDLFGSANLASKTGAIFLKVSTEIWWRFA